MAKSPVQGVDTAEAAAAPADAAPVVDAAPVDAAADAPVIDGAAAGEIVLDDANFPKFGFQVTNTP